MDEDAFDEGLRAISHPDRRRFLQACLESERAAGDLSAASDLSIATVSEHLKVLRKSGLLVLNKQGRFWFYRTDRDRLHQLADAVARLAEV